MLVVMEIPMSVQYDTPDREGPGGVQDVVAATAAYQRGTGRIDRPVKGGVAREINARQARQAKDLQVLG